MRSLEATFQNLTVESSLPTGSDGGNAAVVSSTVVNQVSTPTSLVGLQNADTLVMHPFWVVPHSYVIPQVPLVSQAQSQALHQMSQQLEALSLHQQVVQPSPVFFQFQSSQIHKPSSATAASPGSMAAISSSSTTANSSSSATVTSSSSATATFPNWSAITTAAITASA